jgi:hypothetical protein
VPGGIEDRREKDARLGGVVVKRPRFAGVARFA